MVFRGWFDTFGVVEGVIWRGVLYFRVVLGLGIGVMTGQVNGKEVGKIKWKGGQKPMGRWSRKEEKWSNKSGQEIIVRKRSFLVRKIFIY